MHFLWNKPPSLLLMIPLITLKSHSHTPGAGFPVMKGTTSAVTGCGSVILPLHNPPLETDGGQNKRWGSDLEK